MGMYTEFHFNADLIKEGLDEKTQEILDYMFGNIEEEPEILPEHNLFNSPRWSWFVRSSSAYFPHEPASSFGHREYSSRYQLSIRCDLKNYEDEIELFIEWIEGFVEDRDEMLGFSRYEDTDIMNIYYIDDDGKIVTKPFDFRN